MRWSLRPVRWAVGGDEPQHIGRAHLVRRLVDHAEEHPQVIPGGEHRVRSAPTRQELQIVIDQRHPEPHHRLTGGSSRTDQTGVEQGHLGASSSVDG